MSQATAMAASRTSGVVSYSAAWLVKTARPFGMTERFVMLAFVIAASKNETPYSS
jgi:hypothetical protein